MRRYPREERFCLPAAYPSGAKTKITALRTREIAGLRKSFSQKEYPEMTAALLTVLCTKAGEGVTSGMLPNNTPS